MAYFAVVSVMHTIQRLLNSSQISIVTSSLEIIQSAYNEVGSVQQVLWGLDDCRSSIKRKRLEALDAQIRVPVFKLEDVLESHLSEHFFTQSEEIIGDESCSIALFSIDEEEIQTLVETVKKMKEEYAEELGKPEEEDEDNYAVSSEYIDFGGKKLNIFGLSDDELTELKHQIMESKNYEFRIVSIVGQGGAARNTISQLVCEEASHIMGFERCAVVRIGQQCQVQDILIGILSQIDDEHDQKLLISDSEYEKSLGERLYTCLKGSRYLIVLDDVWEIEVWNLLRSSFPKEDYGSRVFLITSLMEVARFADSYSIYELETSSYRRHHAEEISRIQLILSEEYDEMSEDDDDYDGDGDGKMFSEDITEDLQLRNSYHDGGGDDIFTTAETIVQMCELSYYVDHIMYVETNPKWSCGHHKIQCIFGMAGIGKTTVARGIYEDPLHRYDLHAWITLGPSYQSENILADILDQIDPDIDKMHMMKGDEMLAEHFWTRASHKRCLIVLDDVWSVDPLTHVHKLFDKIKCEVLLTTRLRSVSDFSLLQRDSVYSEVYHMRLLNKEESWHFLRGLVFADNFCPPELEKLGKMIAEECDGLPLMIAMVADVLSEADKTLEYWTKVAKKHNVVFEHAYDKISDMLYPSYEYLPQCLKASFLYMGVFPKKYEIPMSKLLKLWSFEGIIEDEKELTIEIVAGGYVRGLVSRSLVLDGKTSSSFEIKTSRLHSVYWHLCIREARKNKFFHVLNRYSDGFGENINGQRRLSIQNNVLFGLKDVHDSIASISTARSLLCTGLPHPYSVPICLGLGLLKVLDALTIRFYEFPVKVMHLVHLRYLGLIYDGKLPPSISKLRNLQCLIVRRHLHTKLYGAPSILPMEIWDMKELEHLQVMGSDIPDPCGAVLPNLTTLLDMSAQSVMQGVLRGTPNLEKLGIRIELAPGESEPMFSFDHLCHLDKLKSLKCVIVNPELSRSGNVASPPPILSLPSSLEKLCLSGFGFPWESIRTIGRMPNLRVLKLRCHAFRGPEWVMYEHEFWPLTYLLLEDADVEYMKTHGGQFIRLDRLIIRHCYKLKSFPLDNQTIGFEVELDDCSTSASKFLQENKQHVVANVHCSWEE